jgi:hypothetical protein
MNGMKNRRRLERMRWSRKERKGRIEVEERERREGNHAQ